MTDEAKYIVDQIMQSDQTQIRIFLAAGGGFMGYLFTLHKKVAATDSNVSVVQNDVAHMKGTMEKIEGKIDNLNSK